jgi:hypothetical protein
MKRRTAKPRSGLIALGIMMMIFLSLVANAQKKIVGYIPTGYSTASVDFTRITHLNIAFENPDAAGNLSYNGGNDAFVTTAHNNSVKVLVSICGGGASNDATYQARYTSLMSAANRASFISKIVSYLNAHNLDGIDLDLEGPAINSNYSDFVIALKAALPAGKLLTAALAHDNGGNVPTPASIQTLDFLNIMAYDMGWGQAVHHSTYSYATTCINWWMTNKGLPASKVVLGVPFYGYTNTTGNGGISFASILSTYGTAAAQQDTWVSGGNTIYYNGIPTIRQKSQLVVDQNYGGIMIWQLAQDATGSNSLLVNIKQVLGTTSCSPTAIVPYLSVNGGAWQNTGSASLNAGGSFTLGPNPTTGGSWKWIGPNGFTSTAREITRTSVTTSMGGSYIATYTNTCGANSTYTFNITINGGATNVTTLYKDCNYSGTAVGLPVGNYTLSQLNAAGILNNDVSSLRVTAGYKVTLFDSDNFTGTSVVVTADNSCLVGNSFNDKATSIQVATNSASFTTKIEAENYINMAGIQTEACSEGGLNVGYFDASDWMTYAVTIPAAGTYKVSYRVASTTTGKTLRLENATPALIGEVTIPNTGGWQVWTTVSHNVSLPAGTYNLGITTYTGGLNLNWFQITNNLGARVATSEVELTDSELISVSPNPVENIISIRSAYFKGGQMKIMDASGREFISGTVDGDVIDASALPTGFYILKVSKNTRTAVAKFIKK